jgi:hypothetical protein
VAPVPLVATATAANSTLMKRNLIFESPFSCFSPVRQRSD